MMSFPFSEETITETVLLDLAQSFGGSVKIVPFNKSQEGKIGADWEWCFYDLDGSEFVRFLMQAKVLDNQDFAYSHIDRFIGNTNVRQIDRLLATAQQRSIPALYAFYNHVSDASRVPVTTCACFGCLECWGATVAAAEAVKQNLPDKSFDQLRDVSTPWACLLCAKLPTNPPAGFPAASGLWPVQNGLLRLRTRTAEARPDLDARIRIPEIERDPPDYLRPVLEFRDRSLPEDVERKLAGSNPGVDGVVLVPAAALRDGPQPREG